MSKEDKVVSFDMFDTTTKADAGVEIEIHRADGEPSGLFITVLGADSTTYQKLREKFDRARIKAMAKGGRAGLDNVLDHAKANDVALAAACTASWRHAAGEMPFPASDKDQLEAFYLKYPLILDQVRVAMSDRANFTKA